MKLRIHFNDGSEKEIDVRYFTIYTKPNGDSMSMIHIEEKNDMGNHWHDLSTITTIVGVNK